MGKIDTQFAGLSRAINDSVVQSITVGASRIANEAQRLITEGSVSGKFHEPSKPGEPPNNNWGTLKNNIEVTQPAPLVALITSAAPYAAALEFGTSKMLARPYMRPAAFMKRDEAAEIIAGAIGRAVRAHFKGGRS